MIDTTVVTGAGGTYTVVVSNASDARSQTGAYDLHFVLIPGANAGGELLDGVTNPGGIVTIVVSDGSGTATGTGWYSILVHGVPAAPPYPPSVFWPSEYQNDPFLLDNAGNPGLGPRIGDPVEPFNVSIDCTAADSPSIYALSLSTGQQSALSTPWGWLYLDGPILLRKFGTHERSVEAWFPEPTGLLVPNDLSLVGMTYMVQGACGGFGGSIRLSGAITQTIGH